MPERLHDTWMRSERAVPRRFVRPLLRFIQVEASGGVVLLAAAAAALIWANAPFGDTYERFWGHHVLVEIGSFHIEETLQEVVNDGLMAIFFFVVGLEIKRELVVGDLRDPRRAALPAFAAFGGMIIPALIYVTLVGGGEASRGWGIPMATDIAFSVGVVALLGTRVPVGAKLFLLALAIVDDIGAIAVIAVFYTDELEFAWLAASLLAIAAMAVAKRVGIRAVTFYTILGVFAWLALLESGVHATLAGVAIGLLTPARPLYRDEEYHRIADQILVRTPHPGPRLQERQDAAALTLSAVATESVSPLNRLERALQPWSSFVIVPIFALANAGVRFAGIDFVDTATSSVALGVGIGLVVGKLVGVSFFTWLAVRLGFGKLPRATGWVHIIGLAALAGIGFTVSLFVTSLAFAHPMITDQAKTGIFLGSSLAGIIGYTFLRSIRPQDPNQGRPPA